jgi:hypothetical protein
MLGLAHKGLFKCPLCGDIISVRLGLRHLQEIHGAKVEFRRLPAGLKPTAVPYTVYEYGKPFWEIKREQIPEEKWETERIYNGELKAYLADPQGNRVAIGNPSIFTYEMIRQLREQGLDAQYIRLTLETGDILAQARGSPPDWIAIIIVLVLIAVCLYLFKETAKAIIEGLWRIFVAPIPPEWRPFFFATILGVVGIVAVGYALPRIRGTAT